MSLIIKLGVLLFILIDNANSQIFDECPHGTFYQNGVCLPNSIKHKCPPNTFYKDGVCQYTTGSKCPSGTAMIDGVCINKSAPPCYGNSQQCTSATNCQGSNLNNCPYREICPENYVLFQGSCISNNIASCPFGTKLQYGRCINESICPPNSHLENNVCVQDIIPLNLNCPFGSHLEGINCVLDANVVCPVGTIFKNKTCSKPCAENAFLINGACAQCPENSEYSNGQCVKCKDTMIFNNGRCSCPPLKSLLNGECVTINVEKCSSKEFYSNGKCVLRYCYGNQCCKTTYCNDCFETCNQIINTTQDLSKCHKNCINNILPTIPADPVVELKPNVTLPIVNKIKKRPTIVNIANVANHTEEQNVHTTHNSGNITNINLDSNGQSQSSEPKVNPKKSTPCCMITDPRKCTTIDGKTVCYHRRHHECGSQCFTRKTHFHVPASEVHKNVETEYMPMFMPPPKPQKFIPQPFLFPQQQQIAVPSQIPQYTQPMYIPQTIPKQTIIRQQYPVQQQFYQPSFAYPQPTVYNPQPISSSFYMPNQGFATPEIQYQQYPYIQNYQQYQQDISPYDCLSCATMECKNFCLARGYQTN